MKRKKFKSALKRRLDTVIGKWMSCGEHPELRQEAGKKEVELVNWVMAQFDELEKGGLD